MNKFPHDRGWLRKTYTGGGRNSDEGKVVVVVVIVLERLVRCCQVHWNRNPERIHKIRVIQVINNRVANTRTKMVGASATKTIGVSVRNILVKTIEWGYEMK
jgi:hypothetical protein